MLFFLSNKGVPKEDTLMGIPILRDCVCYSFMTLFNKFHEVHLDNIYMSTKCVHLSYTHHNCVKVQGSVELVVGEYQGNYCKPSCTIIKQLIE